MTDKMKVYKDLLKNQHVTENSEINLDSAVLGGFPLTVVESSYNQNNDVTEHKSFFNNNFHDNMYISPFKLTVKAILYNDLKEEIETLVENSRSRNYTYFYYSKYDKLYVPVAITSFSFSENSESSNTLMVEFELVEVSMLKLQARSGKSITTGVYNPRANISRKDLYTFNPSKNLSYRYSKDKRVGGLY